MGDGTSDGVQTPKQPGVIVREGEIFPKIPEYILKLSPEQIQNRIDELNVVMEANNNILIPNPSRIENIEHSLAVHEFAKTAVERQLKTKERL